MAKKKTKTSENNNQIASGVTTTGIGYQGNLTVKLTNGKKVLSAKTYHNAGTKELFKFICNCLAGNFATSSRPCRIQLYGHAGCGITPSDFDATHA